MESPLIIYKRPRLRTPSLVIGWMDAGLVGISATDYLTDQLGAEEFAEIEPPDFSLLPLSLIKGGVLQEIEYPASCFYYWKNKKSTSDLIILGSKPPDVRRYEFANLVLDLAELFKVKRIYTVGGIRADIPETEEPRVFAIVNNYRLKKYVTQQGLELGTDYHGPTTMSGLILGIAKHRDIEGISLWGEVPNDTAETPNPTVCEAVLSVLTRLLGLDIDLSDIDAKYGGRQADELIGYVRQPDLDLHPPMEKLQKGVSPEISEKDKQTFFDELEKFLKKQKGRGENGPV
ncbi:MAG: hypothetical protein HW402_995 [Dehalococcoidales bacterium]|nr:hypothetical protein [Dehalococcoidales bacterium]